MTKILLLTSLLWFWTALAGPNEPKNITLEGTLRTGLVAIGGETTGTRLDTKSGRVELDLGDHQELRQQADQLAGRLVVATGRLVVRQGVEVAARRIIIVTSLEEAKKK